jgi:hypothetical protein
LNKFFISDWASLARRFGFFEIVLLREKDRFHDREGDAEQPAQPSFFRLTLTRKA